MSIEAMKLALVALESKYLVNCGAWRVQQDQAITALSQAIAEAEQNQFNPDWDAMAVMVEEQQRMAKRIEELEAEQAQPVAYSYTSKITGAQGFSHHPLPRFTDVEHWDIIPLYTAPPQRKPLTDEEIESVFKQVEVSDFYDCVKPFARAIEAAHGIKGEA